MFCRLSNTAFGPSVHTREPLFVHANENSPRVRGACWRLRCAALRRMHTPHACTRLMKKLGGRTGAVGGGGWLQLREVLAGHHHLDGSLDLLQDRVLLDDLDVKGLLRRRGGLGTHDCCRGRHIVFLLLEKIGNDLNGDSDSPDRSLGCADLSVIIHTWMINDLGDLALS